MFRALTKVANMFSKSVVNETDEKTNKVHDNWKNTSKWWQLILNLYKKGGFNPRFAYYRYKFNYYPKKFKVSDFPTDVMCEITNKCNLTCKMCFHSDDSLDILGTTDTNVMDIELFKKIVDECATNKLPALKLSYRGESLLHPKFIEMLRYAKSNGILEVACVTNATALTEKKAQQIIDEGLDVLIISSDGLTKETFEKIRQGADYDKVMRNIENLLELRGTGYKPFIRMQYTEQSDNAHETVDFIKYWKNIVDEVTVSYMCEFDSPEKSKSGEARFFKENHVPAKDRQIHEFKCHQPWQRLVVLADGRVTLCSPDVMATYQLGNVRHTTLKEMWNSKKMNAMRKLQKSGEYYKIPMCKICVDNTNYANRQEEKRKIEHGI